jgi:hypothetical protein
MLETAKNTPPKTHSRPKLVLSKKITMIVLLRNFKNLVEHSSRETKMPFVALISVLPHSDELL